MRCLRSNLGVSLFRRGERRSSGRVRSPEAMSNDTSLPLSKRVPRLAIIRFQRRSTQITNEIRVPVCALRVISFHDFRLAKRNDEHLIASHKISKFSGFLRPNLWNGRARRYQTRKCHCNQTERPPHPISLAFTTLPPCVSRTASPISSSSTGRPCSASQKAERKL